MKTNNNNFAEDRNKSSGFTKSVSNTLCKVCGGDHNVFVINLETGNYIIPRPFFFEKLAKDRSDINNTNLKKSTVPIKPEDIFWTLGVGDIQ